MRFKKLGSDDVGESTSRRHTDPETGQEEINITDAELAMTPPLEEEPDFRDILPDQIHEFRSDEDEAEERDVTVQPTDRLRPLPRDNLPRG
jgi:hypothetical protein